MNGIGVEKLDRKLGAKGLKYKQTRRKTNKNKNK